MPTPRDLDELLVVQFKLMGVENDAKTTEAGRPIFDDLEMCEIRSAGSKDVKYFPALSLCTNWLVDPFTGRQHQITYAERFPRQYQQFKARAAQTVTGTPLDFAPFLTDGKRAELRAMNIYIVEALAAIDGQELKNLGPGGREMKNKAMQWMEDAKTGAADRQLVREIEVLKAKNQVLEDDLKAAREAKAAAPLPKTVTDEAAVAFGEDDFVNMTEEQLIVYITHHTGKQPHGSLPRKTLLRMAQEATPSKAA